jgi:hypothetical protein
MSCAGRREGGRVSHGAPASAAPPLLQAGPSGGTQPSCSWQQKTDLLTVWTSNDRSPSPEGGAASVCCWLALRRQARIAIGSTTHNKQAHRNEQVLWAGDARDPLGARWAAARSLSTAPTSSPSQIRKKCLGRGRPPPAPPPWGAAARRGRNVLIAEQQVTPTLARDSHQDTETQTSTFCEYPAEPCAPAGPLRSYLGRV